VVTLVAGPASTYVSIRIETGARAADLPASLRDQVAPLLAARAFDTTEAMASYGLQPPRAHLVYRRSDGTTVDVGLGSSTFDLHFVYARRIGDPRVAIVPTDVARPVLALVGVVVGSPA
jgi:hypothetical protein